MKIFRKRCKPQNSNKDNYTLEERQRILDYLADKTDIYSLAIRFSFFVPLRISETCAIKYSDVRNGQLHIQRAQRTCQKMNDDLTFDTRYLTNEERIKGNKASGFRTIPLTDTALSIIEQTHSLSQPQKRAQKPKNTANMRLTNIYKQFWPKIFFCRKKREKTLNLSVFSLLS